MKWAIQGEHKPESTINKRRGMLFFPPDSICSQRLVTLEEPAGGEMIGKMCTVIYNSCTLCTYFVWFKVVVSVVLFVFAAKGGSLLFPHRTSRRCCRPNILATWHFLWKQFSVESFQALCYHVSTDLDKT